MNDSIKKVLDFHTTFNQRVGTSPTALEPLEVRQLRIKLLFEELAELAEASDCKMTMTELCFNYFGPHLKLEDHECVDGDNVNKIEELDALADIQYVLNGKIITSGLQEVFDSAFNVVHENNMTKAHTSLDHAKKTAREKGLIGHQIVTRDNHKFLLYNGDGKLIKPYDHVKVGLENFVK